MKSLLFILTLIFATSAYAYNLSDKIKIGSNAKTSKLEIRCNSKRTKILKANVVIINANGKEVRAFKCDIKKGKNAVCMQDALTLDEGIYTVKMMIKNKTSSTKLVLFN